MSFFLLLLLLLLSIYMLALLNKEVTLFIFCWCCCWRGWVGLLLVLNGEIPKAGGGGEFVDAGSGCDGCWGCWGGCSGVFLIIMGSYKTTMPCWAWFRHWNPLRGDPSNTSYSSRMSIWKSLYKSFIIQCSCTRVWYCWLPLNMLDWVISFSFW